MTMAGVEELYRLFGVLADSKDKVGEVSLKHRRIKMAAIKLHMLSCY
jgi:hypothetical protein